MLLLLFLLFSYLLILSACQEETEQGSDCGRIQAGSLGTRARHGLPLSFPVLSSLARLVPEASQPLRAKDSSDTPNARPSQTCSCHGHWWQAAARCCKKPWCPAHLCTLRPFHEITQSTAAAAIRRCASKAWSSSELDTHVGTAGLAHEY